MKSTHKQLNDTQLRSLKSKDKLYRIADSNGLAIEVAVSGSKIWRYRYRFNNKPTMITLGHYPVMSLLDARQARDASRQLLIQGINPKEHKTKETLSGKTFSNVFVEWHNNKMDEWSIDYANDVKQRAECYLLPFIGSKLMGEITTPEILGLLKKIEQRDLLDTLEKIKGIASRVFSYAVGMGYVTVNPVRDLPRDVFKKKNQQHYSTITNPKEIGFLLRAIDGHKGSYQVRTALIIAPHLFLRPGELVGLTWKEIDFNNKLIRIDGARMKMKLSHIVPLSNQVLDILKELSRIQTGSQFVFPSLKNRNQSITTASLLNSIRSLGFSKEQFTTHGFRHMASTRLNELGFRDDVIERQLAHTDSNKVRAVYNHAEHLDDRIDMMQKWSDYLDKLKND
jgi:integrase